MLHRIAVKSKNTVTSNGVVEMAKCLKPLTGIANGGLHPNPD